MYFADAVVAEEDCKEDEEEDDATHKNENETTGMAKASGGATTSSAAAVSAPDQLLAKRSKHRDSGLSPQIFNGLHIPLILRELHAFLKAPVAGGLGTQVRCFIERDRSGVNKMAPVYTLFADHEDGSGRLLLCARKMWKSREVRGGEERRMTGAKEQQKHYTAFLHYISNILSFSSTLLLVASLIAASLRNIH